MNLSGLLDVCDIKIVLLIFASAVLKTVSEIVLLSKIELFM